MRSSTPYILTATLAAIASSCNLAGAATLTVHTQTPRVNIHVPPPKVSSTVTRVGHQDIHIIKQTDKSSPKLFEGTSNGKHLSKATVYDKKSPKGDDRPQESLGFNYGEVKYQYTHQ